MKYAVKKLINLICFKLKLSKSYKWSGYIQQLYLGNFHHNIFLLKFEELKIDTQE